jgi:hypothetical protein
MTNRRLVAMLSIFAIVLLAVAYIADIGWLAYVAAGIFVAALGTLVAGS